MQKKVFVKKIFLLLILVLAYPILYKIYSTRVNAFGCFDDCFNYVAGYFVLKGKALYSEIFFNHQPLMAYISYFIQRITQPENIYELVLRHRQFVFLFGFLMNLLIVLRFNFAGLGFALFYEFSKFYVFGDRFLAEGLITYPLVYLAGLIIYKFQNKHIKNIEYLLAAIFLWFVLFLRLPFALAVIFMYALLLWKRRFRKIQIYSIIIASILIVITLSIFNIPEYFFNIYTVNTATILQSEVRSGNFFGIDIFKSFAYPFLIIWKGQWNIFRRLLIGVDIIFLISFFINLFSKKNLKLSLVILAILGLSNFRVVEPGDIFYGSFHMVVWYGIFIIITFLLVEMIYSKNKQIALILSLGCAVLFFYYVFFSVSFLHDKIDPHFDLITNYGNDMQVGEVVNKFSNPDDTLFLDGFDDLIYWQAKRLSPYKYSWYTSVMPQISKYAKARIDMFKNNPPDFYYGTCPDKKVKQWTMPKKYIKNYQQLYSLGKPTCLYIHKTKLPEITKEQWIKAKESLYELPESFSL